MYSARNIGHAIYRALGYAPPERVRWRINADANFNLAFTRIGDKWVPYDPLALDCQLDESVTLLRSNTAPTLR